MSSVKCNNNAGHIRTANNTAQEDREIQAAKAVSLYKSTSFGLETLPEELRQMIYGFMFDPNVSSASATSAPHLRRLVQIHMRGSPSIDVGEAFFLASASL